MIKDCVKITERDCLPDIKHCIGDVPPNRIVLVPLGTNYDTFYPQASFPYYSQSFSQIPISVHYVVSVDGRVSQYLPVTEEVNGQVQNNVAFGIRSLYKAGCPEPLLPDCTEFEELCETNKGNIYIGVEYDFPTNDITMINACPPNYQLPDGQEYILGKLICCLMKENNISPTNQTLIDGFQLDNRLTQFRIPNTFLSYVISLYSNNCNLPASQSTIPTNNNSQSSEEEECENCTDDTCCPEHFAHIQSLTHIVENLSETVVVLDGRVSVLEGRIDAIDSSLQTNNALLLQVMQQLEVMDECFRCLCDGSTQSTIIEYEAQGTENYQILVPFAPTRLRLPIQISDTSPASVTTTSYTTVVLNENCNYRLEAEVLLDFDEYDDGSLVYIEAVYCGNRVRIAEETVSGGGVVSLSGSELITPPQIPCNVYFEVFTNDQKTPSKTITYSKIKLFCS